MRQSGIRTLSDLVFHIRDRSAGRPDLLSINRKRRRETLSTSDFLGGIHSLALALDAREIAKGERVAVFSENRPEWHMVDFSCQLLGVVTVPIYPTLSADQVAYILRNSGATWVFYSDQKKRDLLLELRGALTRDLRLVALDEDARADEELSLIPLQGEGAAERSALPLERLRGRVGPDDLASIIYTSGTTGDPKGVMLTHHNFVSNFLACRDLFPLGPDDQALSFLPLSHVFERTVDHLFFYRGVAIHYAPSIERVPPLLLEVQPTVLTSVPRLYERAYLRVMGTMVRETPRRQRIFRWAVKVGHQYAARRRRFVSPWLAMKRALADRFVYRKIKQRFGGRMRFAISGGAPLGEEIGEFFHAVGLRLYQGYGLTETSPVLAANGPGTERRGSVGRAIEGVELRIADDSEILARSDGVMAGYWDNPEATASVLDDQGWFSTGDVGYLDDDGFLFITDRKKDMLITSGGKNIAPQPIEGLLTSHWSIAQAVVVGDNYPYVTALLVPRFEELQEQLPGLTPAEIAREPKAREILGAAVADVNERLSEHERIRRWTVMDREFSPENGEITPTLKVRRRVVVQRYADLISEMYLKTQKVPTRGA